MAAKNCTARVLELLGKESNLTEKEVDAVVSKIRSVYKKHGGNAELIASDVKYYLDNYRKLKLNEVRIKALKAGLLDSDLLSFKRSEVFQRNPEKFFEAKLTGIDGLAFKGNNSVDLNYKTIKSKVSNMLLNELDEKGLTPLFSEGTLSKEIMIELFELRKGGTPGKSGSTPAKEIAEIVNKVQSYKVRLLQKYGASITELDGYIMRQTHSESKVASVKYNEWRDFILSKLDTEKTFKGMDERSAEEFLFNKYQKIRDGSYNREFQMDDVPVGGKSRAFDNLDDRLSKSRSFHFKDGQSFFEYNEKFGSSNFAETVWRGIDKGARDAAVLKVLGPSPNQYMKVLKQTIGREVKESPEALGRLTDKWKDIERLYDTAVRRSDGVPGRNLIAKSTRALNGLQVASKLGSATISSINDTITAISALRSATGKGFLSGAFDMMGQYTSVISKSDRKLWAKRLGILSQDIIGDYFDRFGATQGIEPGIIAKGARAILRISGLDAHTQIATVAAAKQFSLELGDFSSKSFGELTARVKANLERYGIDTVEWEVIRKGVQNFEGSSYLTPEGVESLADSVFTKAFEVKKSGVINTLEKYKLDLSDKVSQYLTDNADNAVLKGTSRERKMLLQGTREDEPIGALLRILTQFKTFPLSMVRHMGRTLLSDPSKSAGTVGELLEFKRLIRGQSGDLMGFAGATLGLTMAGYMSKTAKDLVQGRTPPDPTSPMIVADSFLEGGAAGLYGDFLNLLVHKRHGSAIASLLGPTVGAVDNLFEIYHKALNGENIGGQTFRTIWRNVPGQNVWFLRGALDYVIYHEAMEYLSPGFKSRLESRVEKNPGLIEENQRYFLGP